ncbi:aminopeptidase Y [Magnaporthiopsis poae ATCC 64411]|uniref:Peptide hydrolase n=1 Tax=Magnaporthiopsis poae (strain ATCC 64411 / 73-15) TaxID=644358 RepID=A0A0C4EFX8_MAGP6|nr:aminopeptidase Y [Magnaporthiopsis poae ATCC 64411]
MKISKALALWAVLPGLAHSKDCKPPVESAKLQGLITADGLMGNLQKLHDIASANGGNRAFGLPGYAASVDFIFGEISKLKSFNVWKQDLPAMFTLTTAAETVIEGVPWRTVALTYTPSTPEGGITREIVLGPEGAAGCDAANYEGRGAAGKIVLVERGLCPDQTTFAGKLKAAAAAGAASVLIYNLNEAKLTAGSLSRPNPAYVPGVIVDRAPALAIKARIEAGEKIEAFSNIQQLIEERITQNVIAETKKGDPTNVVMLGAHLDSVQAGAGINDDGSGTSLILELAKGLSRFSTTNKVRFAWWAAEENGLWGSNYYVEKLAASPEVDNLLCYLNFDMVSRGVHYVFDGTGDRAGPGGAPGSAEIEKLLAESLTAQGKTIKPAGLTGGTDYVPFKEIIHKPVGGLFTGTGIDEDACYHQACDNITNARPELIHPNALAAAHALAILAVDGTKLIPKTPANATVGRIRRLRDAGIGAQIDFSATHGKHCDHDLI